MTGPDHWALVGGALGQRLAFATQHAPPYPALLGAHRAGFADWATLDRAAAAFPTHTRHARVGGQGARGALQHRPLPGGGWLDLDAEPSAELRGRATTGTRPALLLDLARRLARFLAEHAPPGRVADTRGAETVLARAAVVLTHLETAYRTGAPTDDTAILWAGDDVTVDALLADVPATLAGELVDLATRAHACGVLARLAPGIAAPVFVEHWAEGDLLIPAGPGRDRGSSGSRGQGCMLVDVKTVMSARDPDKVARWLWQLLGLHLARPRPRRPPPHHPGRAVLRPPWPPHHLGRRRPRRSPAGRRRPRPGPRRVPRPRRRRVAPRVRPRLFPLAASFLT